MSARTANRPSAVKASVPAQPEALTTFPARAGDVNITAAARAARLRAYNQAFESANNSGDVVKRLVGAHRPGKKRRGRSNCQARMLIQASKAPKVAVSQEYDTEARDMRSPTMVVVARVSRTRVIMTYMADLFYQVCDQ